MTSIKTRLILFDVFTLLILLWNGDLRTTWFSVLTLACTLILGNLAVWRLHIWNENFMSPEWGHSTAHSCSGEWARHRKQTRTLWVLFACLVPCAALAYEFLKWTHFVLVSEAIVIIAVVLYLLTLVGFNATVISFACPRCSEPF